MNTNIDAFTRIGCNKSHRLRVEMSLHRVELQLDGRVDMRQIRQIRQKICKLRSPVHPYRLQMVYLIQLLYVYSLKRKMIFILNVVSILEKNWVFLPSHFGSGELTMG